MDDIYAPTANPLPIIQIKCFAPETLVSTPIGQRPISDISEGDMVNAFDFTSGDWTPRRVTEKHNNVYEGPVLTIFTTSGRIRTTVYHPFWVWNGRDLHERSTPRELAENEDQGKALLGRWVNSHELRVGDVFVSCDGEKKTILKIEQEYHTGFQVNNLTIEDYHTFAVGRDGILVHNTTLCDLFPNGFLGKTQQQVLNKAPKSWVKVPVNNGNGWKLLDENLVERIRFMRPNKNGTFSHEKSGYWRVKDDADRYLDEFGNVVDNNLETFNVLTHIPYSGLR